MRCGVITGHGAPCTLPAAHEGDHDSYARATPRFAEARVWVEVSTTRWGDTCRAYLDVIAQMLPVRALPLMPGDLGAAPWDRLQQHFVRPVGDALTWNIVMSSDESLLDRLFTFNLVNIAIVDTIRPQAAWALRRWDVLTVREWSLADYHLDTRWTPLHDPHALANALMGAGERLRERVENLVQARGHDVSASP